MKRPTDSIKNLILEISVQKTSKKLFLSGMYLQQNFNPIYVWLVIQSLSIFEGNLLSKAYPWNIELIKAEGGVSSLVHQLRRLLLKNSTFYKEVQSL